MRKVHCCLPSGPGYLPSTIENVVLVASSLNPTPVASCSCATLTNCSGLSCNPVAIDQTSCPVRLTKYCLQQSPMHVSHGRMDQRLSFAFEGAGPRALERRLAMQRHIFVVTLAAC